MDTSLRIALCDSSVGDRKQTERLLSRESDRRRNTTGVFYVDVFGTAGSILSTNMIYDVYILDATEPEADSVYIANALRNKGVTTPILFCISTIDYSSSPNIPDNSLFINKPLIVSELSNTIDRIIEIKKQNYTPKIELRNNSETFYLEQDEIVYIHGNKYDSDIHLKNGTVKKVIMTPQKLWFEICSFPAFFAISTSTIVNIHHIECISFMHVVMPDKHKYHIKLNYIKPLKRKVRCYESV